MSDTSAMPTVPISYAHSYMVQRQTQGTVKVHSLFRFHQQHKYPFVCVWGGEGGLCIFTTHHKTQRCSIARTSCDTFLMPCLYFMSYWLVDLLGLFVSLKDTVTDKDGKSVFLSAGSLSTGHNDPLLCQAGTRVSNSSQVSHVLARDQVFGSFSSAFLCL